ncbi:hypothetical protein NUW54_g10114 [Trametes sanguinea]|uniref:Uncharacterized protein n=1 Tax=Trametes sanguinea TaxID=158606 RepID=A0ACC1P1D9_9APHY|nr:hypothetical protein NUW54_g10114 [Trametes sanguinea]
MMAAVDARAWAGEVRMYRAKSRLGRNAAGWTGMQLDAPGRTRRGHTLHALRASTACSVCYHDHRFTARTHYYITSTAVAKISRRPFSSLDTHTLSEQTRDTQRVSRPRPAVARQWTFGGIAIVAASVRHHRASPGRTQCPPVAARSVFCADRGTALAPCAALCSCSSAQMSVKCTRSLSSDHSNCILGSSAQMHTRHGWPLTAGRPLVDVFRADQGAVLGPRPALCSRASAQTSLKHTWSL